MKKRLFAIASTALFAAATLAGCIENDIPYPVVECQVESITAEGLAGEALIDPSTRSVTLPLLETTDIENVRITDAQFTKGATSSLPIAGVHNLTSPLAFTLSLYDDYEWQIAARQSIDRHFTVEGQVGATEWDLEKHTAKAYVGYRGSEPFDPSMRPSAVRVKSLKLGPAGITKMSVTPEGIEDFDRRDPDKPWDFTTYRNVEVTCHGRTETWALYVDYTDLKVDLSRVDGWVRKAWFYGEGLSGTDLGFRYREKGSEEWTTVPAECITVDGGSFTAEVKGLEPETDYEAVAYSDSDDSAVMAFRTERELPLPNADFETWSTSGNIICPYSSVSEMFWDTGNKGSTTLGPDYNITTAVHNDLRPGSTGTTSARLASRWVVLKFAAGNIFTGEYAKTEGTNGRINFGRPFTSHPTALHGWVKFSNGEINRVGTLPKGVNAGDPDEGHIYVALGTWKAADYGGTETSPVQVYSADASTFFNKDRAEVIGYGEKVLGAPTNGWEEFTINIDYKATDIVPTHIIIVCSASRWGDYFTGCDQNVMLIDDFELKWE